METPGSEPTAEFGAVVAGGPTHHYPGAGASFAVKKFSVGAWDNNVYVLESDGQALIIDGANDAPRILSEVDGLHVVGIVQTHGHFDHVQALDELVAALGCPVWAHPMDASLMPVATTPLAGGETLHVGSVEVRVEHTPGHTPGSTCFVAGDYLFSGDTLFPGGPGNTEGDATRFASIMEELDKKLFTLPDATRVCPGHGLDTFIGRERPHMQIWHDRGW